MIMNLVINASEALGNETGAVLIKTGETTCNRASLAQTCLGDDLAEGAYSYLEVRDTGSGMAPEVLSRIFDPFFTTKFAGRGLGLAAVMGIMRSHKGGIQVNSSPGKGTSIRMLFPVAQGAPATAAAPAQVELGWHMEGKILVADDEEKVRDVTRRMIERVGFEVVVATDGPEAVSLLQQYAPAIRAIVLDLTMPNMSAEQAFDRLREIDDSIPIVICSGYTASCRCPSRTPTSSES